MKTRKTRKKASPAQLAQHSFKISNDFKPEFRETIPLNRATFENGAVEHGKLTTDYLIAEK